MPTAFMSEPNLPGGTPLASAEHLAADQAAQLQAVVAEAFRLMPTATVNIAGAGAGQGEGVAADVIDRIVKSLLDLYALTGGDAVAVLDWLSTGLATAPPGDDGDPAAAAMRVRDLLLEVLVGLDQGQPDRLEESDEALRAAETFIDGVIQVAGP
jgi:hypothetical protein